MKAMKELIEHTVCLCVAIAAVSFTCSIVFAGIYKLYVAWGMPL